MIDGTSYLRHRLVWLYVHGAWPKGGLDHKDGLEKGDGIGNLRPATQSQNTANSRRRASSTSGLKGVAKFRQKWRARLMHNAKDIHLGCFDTPEAAHDAYKQAAQKLFGEFARFE
jgi:hypothetical protein